MFSLFAFVVLLLTVFSAARENDIIEIITLLDQDNNGILEGKELKILIASNGVEVRWFVPDDEINDFFAQIKEAVPLLCVRDGIELLTITTSCFMSVFLDVTKDQSEKEFMNRMAEAKANIVEASRQFNAIEL